MNKLPAAIMRANARYFVKQGWESPDILPRLDMWLNGRADKEVGKKVVSWCASDAQWIKEISPAMARHFWYVIPMVFFVGWRLYTLWLSEAKRIRADGYRDLARKE